MNIERNTMWPMLFVTLLTVGFFAGGVWLEFDSSDHGIRKIVKELSANQDLLNEAIKFQTQRAERIHAAAAAAIDLAKIGLGALVVLATQSIHGNRQDSGASRDA
ncbi:hypothetical protein RQP53_20915 [Paucibacter sp. APW11]|uniref:Uncharacterized protein n=1 Tax=Roseateles aquae TaxID=3077235 RepID=A0ABU3PHB2_9BURK|nr:hypothetical protein [Paucibacter sp. APW11]MDT9001752.1 hypothetical protein [Paucibacter sp. APW11]